jgi:hypothetical protein
LRIRRDHRVQASQTKLAELFDNNNYPAHRQPLSGASKNKVESPERPSFHVSEPGFQNQGFSFRRPSAQFVSVVEAVKPEKKT